MVEDVRDAYSPADLWSKVAKRICRRPALLRRRLNWSRAVREFVDEYSYIQDTRGYILEASGERIQDFLVRLTCRLHLHGEMTAAERDAFLRALRTDSPVPELDSERARALVLKACLEFGRLRPSPPKSLSVKDLVEYVRTIDELFDTPIHLPLPRRATLDTMRLTPDEFSRVLARARSTPEYHLAVAHYVADFEYAHAVEYVSCVYASLDDAFLAISRKGARSGVEERFASEYAAMAAMII